MGNQFRRSFSEDPNAERSELDSDYGSANGDKAALSSNVLTPNQLRAPKLRTKSISADIPSTSASVSTLTCDSQKSPSISARQFSDGSDRSSKVLRIYCDMADSHLNNSRSTFANSKMVSLDVPSATDFAYGEYKRSGRLSSPTSPSLPHSSRLKSNSWTAAKMKLTSVVRFGGSNDDVGSSNDDDKQVNKVSPSKGKSVSPDRPRQLKTYFSGCSVVEAKLIAQLWNRVKQTGHNQPAKNILTLMCVKSTEMGDCVHRSWQAGTGEKVTQFTKISIHINATLDKIVNQLDNVEELESYLINVGIFHYSHVRKFGFTPSYWDTFTEVIIKKSIEWCNAQQRERQRNRQLQQSWMKLIFLMVDIMKKGYYKQRRADFAATKTLHASYSPGTSTDVRSSSD